MFGIKNTETVFGLVDNVGEVWFGISNGLVRKGFEVSSFEKTNSFLDIKETKELITWLQERVDEMEKNDA